MTHTQKKNAVNFKMQISPLIQRRGSPFTKRSRVDTLINETIPQSRGAGEQCFGAAWCALVDSIYLTVAAHGVFGGLPGAKEVGL